MSDVSMTGIDTATADQAEAAAPLQPHPRPIRAKTAPALLRLNEYVVAALGTTQRDWLLSVDGVGGLPAPDTDTALVARTAARIDHQNLRRQANLDCILYRALTLLPTRVEEGEHDLDWAPRFFAAAADCGGPERQALWARLLVMEVTRPGAVPPATFRALAGLSGPLLALLRKAAQLAINNFIVRLGDDFFKDRGLNGDAVLLLEEYGLIRTNRDLSKVFRSQVKERFSTNLLYGDNILRVTHDDAKLELTLPCYRLTDAGSTLARALQDEGEIGTDTEYIVEIVRLVQKLGCSVAQADILARANENIVSKHSQFCEIVALKR